MTSRLTDSLANPQPGIQVTFSVDAGPNTGANGACSPNADCTTNANGQVSFTYAGSGGTGLDHIKACFTNQLGEAICSPAVTAQWTLRPIIHYFALGDSFASGHGLGDEGEPCRQSYSRSYPARVRDMLYERYSEVEFHFLACTGATANKPREEELKKSRYKWLKYQVQDTLDNLEVLRTDEPVLVSITIGANDFKFADAGAFLKNLDSSRNSYNNWVDRTAKEVTDSVKSNVELLLNYDNVVVVVTEIHNPYNTESIFFDLPALVFNSPIQGVPLLSKKLRCWPDDCYARTDDAVLSLNKALNDVSSEPSERMQIAEVYTDFLAHASPETGDLRKTCGYNAPGPNDTWIQQPLDDLSNSYPWRSLNTDDVPTKRFKDVLRFILDDWKGDCFHPNDTGALAYAKAVYDAFRLLEP